MYPDLFIRAPVDGCLGGLQLGVALDKATGICVGGFAQPLYGCMPPSPPRTASSSAGSGAWLGGHPERGAGEEQGGVNTSLAG